MSRSRHILALALALSLIGLGASWFITHKSAQQGVDWEVPVQGYDPSDLLRGHFISYRYAWPGFNPEAEKDGYAALCISGAAPNIARVTAIRMGEHEGNCASVARPGFGTLEEMQGLESGILYIDQRKADALQSQLSDPKLEGLVRFRIRADGKLHPISIRFRPRVTLPEPPDE
jgi:hypothetical protein